MGYLNNRSSAPILAAELRNNAIRCLNNSRYSTKTEFNNYFIIHIKSTPNILQSNKTKVAIEIQYL